MTGERGNLRPVHTPFCWPWGEDESLDSHLVFQDRMLQRSRHLAEQNHRIIEMLKELQMGQVEVDAAVAELGVDVQKLNDAGALILAEIATLEGQGVDTSGLTAAVAQLDDAVGSIANISPAQPETPPADDGTGDTTPPADDGSTPPADGTTPPAV